MGFGKKKKETEDGDKKSRGFFGRRMTREPEVRKPAAPVKLYHPTPGKKVTVVVVIILAILLITAGVLYFMVIPRTSLSVQTLYHERLGGGSTGGGININILFTNDGTRRITGLDYTLTVINQSDVQVLRMTENVGMLSSGDFKEVRNGFIGNHLETYYITLSIRFSVEGDSFQKDFSYRTEEDAMNLDFRDTVQG